MSGARLFQPSGSNHSILRYAGHISGVSWKPLTISAWFRAASAAESRTIVFIGDSSSSAYINLQAASDGKVKIWVNNGSATGSAATLASWSTNTWHHVAAYYQGAAGSLWVSLDNQSPGTGTRSGAEPTWSGPRTSIGAHDKTTSSEPMDGSIAHVGLWNAQLESGDLVALSRGVSPALVRPNKLRAYWPLMDRGSGASSRSWAMGGTVLSDSGAVAVTEATTGPRVSPPPLTFGTFPVINHYTGPGAQQSARAATARLRRM